MKNKILFLVVMSILFLTACSEQKEPQNNFKIYPQYLAQGKIILITNNQTDVFNFTEKKINGKTYLILKKDKLEIYIQKEKDKLIINNNLQVSLDFDKIFLNYYLNLLVNSEKIEVTQKDKSAIITLELNGDVQYLHYYFENRSLKRIDIFYKDKRFFRRYEIDSYIKLKGDG
ncbi:hypothetical protein ACAG39_03240 [Caldicellulosiruptoraceae bacterium PP1]